MALDGKWVLALSVWLAACSGMPQTPPPTTDSIVEWSKQGVDAAQIQQRLRDGGKVYRLTPSELLKLHEQGVSDAVLETLQQSWLQDEYQRGFRDGVTRGPGMGPWPCWRFGCW